MDIQDGNSQEFSKSTYVGNPSAVAYDHYTGNVWLAHMESGTISVLRREKDIVYRKVVLSNMGRLYDSVAPTGIAIKPAEG